MSSETRAATRPSGTSVDISLDVTPTHAVSSCAITAGRSPRSSIERIFLPFHRVGASRDRDSGGAGLGLSIAARAAKVHGGSIHAVNADGGGLEVIFRSTSRFTKLYRRFPFLDGTPSRLPLLWLC